MDEHREAAVVADDPKPKVPGFDERPWGTPPYREYAWFVVVVAVLVFAAHEYMTSRPKPKAPEPVIVFRPAPVRPPPPPEPVEHVHEVQVVEPRPMSAFERWNQPRERHWPWRSSSRDGNPPWWKRKRCKH